MCSISHPEQGCCTTNIQCDSLDDDSNVLSCSLWAVNSAAVTVTSTSRSIIPLITTQMSKELGLDSSTK